MDNEIIKQCDYFIRNGGFNCYKGYNCTDKECSDCYYKQLQQLKAENEAYKSSIVANLDRKISKRYVQLLQTLQEIKEIADEFNSVDKFGKSLHPNFYEAFEYIADLIGEVE